MSSSALRSFPRPRLAIALLIAASLALPAAQAKEPAPKRAKTATKASTQPSSKASSKASKKTSNVKAKTVAPSKPKAPIAAESAPAAGTEAADLAELRARIAARSVQLMRRADVDDVAIEVWSLDRPRKYFVAVSAEGALRRTLSSTDMAEAWQRFDTFRRMAAAGDVGRPVLLGQMTDEDAQALDMPVSARAVDVVRRQRFGDEVARMVWNADRQEYLVALTSRGTVVSTLRSRDGDAANRAYEDFLRQAQVRAALLSIGPAASAASAASGPLAAPAAP